MNPTEEQTSIDAAWLEYRAAFKEFSERVRRVHTLTAQPDPDEASIDTALLELEKARRAYNQTRDALADGLLNPAARELFPKETPAVSPSHIKGLAELRWEVAGRPEGTAEQDWRRAEEIIRRAAAA